MTKNLLRWGAAGWAKNQFGERRLGELFFWAQDYNRGFGIIKHNIPKVSANNSFGILRNLISDNKATVFTKLLFVAGK